MKAYRLFSVLLALVILFGTFAFPVTAGESIKVILNETELSFDVPPIIQDGRTLVPLRAVFESLGCDVYWIDELEVIIIVKNEIKLLMRVGYEDFYKFTGYDIELFKQAVYEDEATGSLESYEFDVPPQIIDNRTLVPIRLLSEAMGVNVSWDDVNKIVILTCDNDFILNENTDKTFAGQAFIFFQELEDGDIQYENSGAETEYSLKYEDTTLDILVDLKIISKEDFNKDTYITNLEVMEIIHKIGAYDDIDPDNIGDIKEWYRGYTLEPLDYLDDFYKKLLLDLRHGGRNQIITYDDLLEMKFNENITNYGVLKYVTRMLGNTYGCTDSPEELRFIEKIPTYEVALKKGIIDNIDMESADLSILRQDFYEIIHKAIFVVMDIGGYAPSKGRYIDSIIAKNERVSQPKEETAIHSKEISVEVAFNDDMSISWTLPNEYKHFVDEGFWTSIATITNDGVLRNRTTSTSTYNHISAAQLIQFIVGSYPVKLDYIRCTYYKFESGTSTRDEWFFDIDISNIIMLIAGEELKPGIYTRPKGQWPATSITLADGQMFKEGAYYLLTSRQNVYRKTEYNSVSRGIFKAAETSNTFVNTGGSSSLGTGAIYLDEVHIQEIIIKSNATTGFTLHVTPESKEIFTVKEGT